MPIIHHPVYQRSQTVLLPFARVVDENHLIGNHQHDWHGVRARGGAKKRCASGFLPVMR